MSYFNLEETSPTRSPTELIIFRSIQFSLLIIRFFTLIFFATQTIRHVRLNLTEKGKIDKYILGTLVCMGFSFLGFFVYRGLEIGVDFAMSITDGTPAEEKVIIWK